MRQALVRRKNRKLRLLRALYPEINIKLLYRRDYQRLLERFGIRPDTPTIGSDGAVYTSPPADDSSSAGDTGTE
jgi:hypoxanthine phosphoribosyltransferase